LSAVASDEDLQKTRNRAIIIFILFSVFLGTSLIAAGILGFHGTYYELMLGTIGSALIAVGVVDVVSEVFVRPGIVGILRNTFPLFADPAKLSKDALKKQLVYIAHHIAPKPELAQEFAQFLKKSVADQLTDYCREDFDVSVRLEKISAGPAQGLVKVTSEWKYIIHNTSDRPTTYPIQFYCNTDSFTSKGLGLKDHMAIEKILVTHGVGEPQDVGQKHGVYKQQPRQFDSRVELDLTPSILVELLPNEPMSVYVRYWYIAESRDRHSQRMGMLTHNIALTMDFEKKDFVVIVDDFCSPKRTTIAKFHKYDWKGWLLPNHGFIIEWKPA
jgi:hypothetical protein